MIIEADGLKLYVSTDTQASDVFKLLKKDTAIIKSLNEIIRYKDSIFNLQQVDIDSLNSKIVDLTFNYEEEIQLERDKNNDQSIMFDLKVEEHESCMLELDKITRKTRFEKITNYGWGPFKVKYITSAIAGGVLTYYGHRLISKAH